MLTESEFIAAADETLATIGLALDAAQETGNADVDWSLNDGILDIELGDGSKVIVNRHLPNREIWVAARVGAHHFRAEGGRWRSTRGGDDLAVVLARLLKAQGGVVVRLPALAAPAG